MMENVHHSSIAMVQLHPWFPQPVMSVRVFLLFTSLAITSQQTIEDSKESMQTCPWEPRCHCQDESVYTDNYYHLLVDCSYAGLETIPSSIPNTTTVVSLTGNMITKIPTNSFEHLTLLKYLDLSNNKISSLSEDSFIGLMNLETLELDLNELRYDNISIPEDVFQPLCKLKRLNLRQQFDDVEDSENYPIKALSHLRNLEELLIDGLLGRDFAESFSVLDAANLVRLRMSGTNGRCDLNIITPGMFNFSTNLHTLILENCNIITVNKGSFLELKIIRKLDLSNNKLLEFKSLSNISFGLQNRQMYELRLIGIHRQYGECTRIDEMDLIYAKNISVWHVYLDSNRLSSFSTAAIQYLPQNVSVLSVRDNMLVPADYLLVFAMSAAFPKLIYIDASGQTLYREANHFPKFLYQKRSSYDMFSALHQKRNHKRSKVVDSTSGYNENGTSFGNENTTVNTMLVESPTEESNFLNENNKKYFKPEESAKRTVGEIKRDILSENDETSENGYKIRNMNESTLQFFKDFMEANVQLDIGTTLRDLDLSSLNIRFEIKTFTIKTPNTLTRLNLQNNVLWNWEGPLRGFDRLLNLNLAWNSCEKLSPTFFHSIPGLLTLNLSRNFLDPFISQDEEGLLFEKQTQLKRLDLSDNKLTRLPKKLFKSLINLEDLYLSNNFLTTFDVELSTSKLFFLDLRHDKIEYIGESTTEELNKIADVNGEIKVDLSENNLQCRCDDIDFVHWVESSIGRKNTVKFVNVHKYQCKYQNGSLLQISAAETLYNKLKRECASYLALILVASISTAMTLVAFSFCIVYRYRWNLRYFYYSAKMKFQGYKPIPNQDENEFLYDVFISYSNNSVEIVKDRLVPELEESRNFKVLVHDRDFEAGNLVCDNIMRAITTSRKTLILLSNDFLQSHWCVYEMNMARMEAITTGRDILCVIMLEPIRSSRLPLEIMDIIRNQTYLEWPSDPEQLNDVFWERLAQAIKT